MIGLPVFFVVVTGFQERTVEPASQSVGNQGCPDVVIEVVVHVCEIFVGSIQSLSSTYVQSVDVSGNDTFFVYCAQFVKDFFLWWVRCQPRILCPQVECVKKALKSTYAHIRTWSQIHPFCKAPYPPGCA